MADAGEELGDRVGRGGDLEPAHAAVAEGADGDVDGEDVAEQPGPGLAARRLVLGGGAVGAARRACAARTPWKRVR